jgi:hypothetical protein
MLSIGNYSKSDLKSNVTLGNMEEKSAFMHICPYFQKLVSILNGINLSAQWLEEW